MQEANDVRKVAVKCECGDKETVGSLMAKITEGAAELDRLINASPMDMLSHSIYRTKPCSKCEATGKVFYQNGQDDYDTEQCRACNGTGRVIADA